MNGARISDTCTRCKETVETSVEDVTLYLTSERKGYEWRCSECGTMVLKKANPEIVGLLKEAGVKVVRDEDLYPELPPEDLPPLTLDDLIDFHDELEKGVPW